MGKKKSLFCFTTWVFLAVTIIFKSDFILLLGYKDMVTPVSTASQWGPVERCH